MYSDLYEYLILHQHLRLPGIGTLSVQKIPASFDFTDKLIRPPAFSIAFHTDSPTPSKGFFQWLGAHYGIGERDAVIRFNDFLFGLKNRLSAGDTLQWSGVGILGKDPDGAIRFDADPKEYSPGAAVSAVMVLRQNAAHTVLVGDTEKTSEEIKALAEEPVETGRSRWWIAALAAGILSAAFIAWHFFSGANHPSSVSNRQKMVPKAEAARH